MINSLYNEFLKLDKFRMLCIAFLLISSFTFLISFWMIYTSPTDNKWRKGSLYLFGSIAIFFNLLLISFLYIYVHGGHNELNSIRKATESCCSDFDNCRKTIEDNMKSGKTSVVHPAKS